MLQANRFLAFLVACCCLVNQATAFTTTTSPATQRTTTSLNLSQQSTTTTTTTSSSTLDKDALLRRDRYVVANRFAVRTNQAAKFEKRWATRKSRLATLPGFRYFHLMRRVKVDLEKNEGAEAAVYDEGTDGGNNDDGAMGNYVSFTIWEKKSDFSAWRKGDAFKEAHGGTSIGDFLSKMISSAMVLKGPPRPTFYDGLLHLSSSSSSSNTNKDDIVDGWRSVEADGIHTLPTECFVACNQFFIPPENAVAFEQRWANRESNLKECEGFVSFTMMRRDGQAKQGHGTVPKDEKEPSYVSTTIWKDQTSFENWRKGSAFQKSHGQQQRQQQESTNKDQPEPPNKPLWSKPPQPVFYQGTLVISSEQGP